MAGPAPLLPAPFTGNPPIPAGTSFYVDPGTEAGGQTSITVTHCHAVGADPVSPATGEPGAPTRDYTVFETFTLVRPRSDGRRWHAKPSTVPAAIGQARPSVRDNGGFD